MDNKNDQVEFVVRSTPPFRLKNKKGKKYQGINLLNQFGFLPKVIVVELMEGTKDVLVVRAIVPDEEVDKKTSPILRVKN